MKYIPISISNLKMVRKNLLSLASFTLLLGTLNNVTARTNIGPNGGKVASPSGIAADQCLPATGQIDLDFNNIRAKILGGGDMWWDLASNPRYEIPKGSRKHSLFASSVWVGGIDAGGQLKVAAQTYRQTGNDFWPGPLDKNAEVTKQICEKYDKHWKITKKEVQDFVLASQGAPPEGYTGPAENIMNWPGNNEPNDPYLGNTATDPYLAPFEDVNGDGRYNYNDGDYPRFDFSINSGSGASCQSYLYGDQVIWWVFNDKGNLHTETGAAAIGLEIRAQAFAFSTNDEINNMTFYQYQIVNKAQTDLTNTYMAYWIDPDLGAYIDDFIGSDVKLGLGFCYNSTDIDAPNGDNTYGNRPPAIGIDFFLGPLADANGIDDSLTLNGTGYGDGIIDNERLGMEKCMYFINNATLQGNPSNGTQVYNYMKGLWRDGTPLTYGGNGYNSGTPTNYAFPWNTDPNFALTPWEQTGTANDLRIVESAGPFTLKPGAINYITAGAVWAQSPNGGAKASVELMKSADIKAQALFDNCFKVLNGPDAPDLTAQEMDKELLIYLTNKSSSNNFKEKYIEKDPTITGVPEELKNYKFQGYRIYQLKNEFVSVSELDNSELAREVIKCDIKDSIARLINYIFDPSIGGAVPKIMVDGENKGIKHSFKITEDAFTGTRLVNFKKYYYTVLAYAHNNYKTYDPIIPGALDGQKLPYKSGRLNIKTYTLIPHNPSTEAGGTIAQSTYGMGPEVTRIEGSGNGGNVLDLTQETIDKIIAAGADRSNIVREIKYKGGKSPIGVKVIDPLNVPKGTFTLKFVGKCKYAVDFATSYPPAGLGNTARLRDTIVDLASNLIAYTGETNGNRTFKRVKYIPEMLDSARWMISTTINGKDSSIMADTSIVVNNEQLFPTWGLSVYFGQVNNPGSNLQVDNNGFLESSVEFADITKRWVGFVPDFDGTITENWIRSGQYVSSETPAPPISYNDFPGFDDLQVYENVLLGGGGFAPYRLTSNDPYGPQWNDNLVLAPNPTTNLTFTNRLANTASIDLVITSDKTKWTRSPVFEISDVPALAEGGALKLNLRESFPVDKDGKFSTVITPSSNENDPNYIGGKGMGWFPGYAINVETGERLNIAFGEHSYFVQENGRDMLWNPTSSIRTPEFQERLGGFHYIYIFGHNFDKNQNAQGTLPEPTAMPSYDAGSFIYNKLAKPDSSLFTVLKRQVYRDAMWVGFPILAPNQKLLASDVKIRLRVNNSFKKNYAGKDRFDEIRNQTTGVITTPAKYDSTNVTASTSPKNSNFPLYQFSTDGLETMTNQNTVAKNALELINAVPNPYYAFSEYETNQLDNRIKIINLPAKCSVSIYTVNGTLIRRINKDDSQRSFVEWDLKNQASVPISGGLYLIHVNVDGVGEKVIKWFGVLRPIDLDSF
jgi:hypothetical protein